MQLIGILPFGLAALVVSLSAQAPPAKTPATDLVKQSEAALREGKHEKALTIARQAVTSTPRSFEANHQAGVVSDLVGRYADARTYFNKAIEVAPTPEAKMSARRSIAISYAFENNCKEALKYETAVYNDLLARKDFITASEVAYEAGDICLEAGEYTDALNWYNTGRAATREQRNPEPERRTVWQLRDAHARARLSARRGANAVALEHLKNIEGIFSRGVIHDQAGVYPYLAGYIAFYDDNYKSALPRLQAADANDTSVRNLLAQTYENLGNLADAKETYRKIALTSAHDLATASALPLARSKVSPAKP